MDLLSSSFVMHKCSGFRATRTPLNRRIILQFTQLYNNNNLGIKVAIIFHLPSKYTTEYL